MYSKNKREKVYVIKGDVSGRTFECQCDALTECKGGEVECKNKLVPYYRSDDGKVSWTKNKAEVQEYEDRLQNDIDRVKAFIENSKGKMFVRDEDIKDDPTDLTVFLFGKVCSEKVTWKYELNDRENEEEIHTRMEYWQDTFRSRYGLDYNTMNFSPKWDNTTKRPIQFIESLREITIEEYEELAKKVAEFKVNSVKTQLTSLWNEEKNKEE